MKSRVPKKIDDPLWPNISTSTSLLQNTILKIKYRMCGTVHKYYIPLLCTLLRLPGRQQHCRWTLSAGEGAHISSLVPSHSRSQQGRANLELPQGCLSLKVIDTCFIHESHSPWKWAGLDVTQVIHCTGQGFFSQCQASSAALERLGICYQIEFGKKKVGKDW